MRINIKGIIRLHTFMYTVLCFDKDQQNMFETSDKLLESINIISFSVTNQDVLMNLV